MATLDFPFEGEYYTDEKTRRLYATDASAYRELPEAVAIPRSKDDIISLVNYARDNVKSLIPRTAGTSLAGQVVGNGIVVDISKYFDSVIEINQDEGYAWIQPGIVRDDLNKQLASMGYFFAPETSTANRAMIGGMIGNNSCGSNSVVYGSTREHLLEVKMVLSDGSEAWFGPLDNDAFLARCNGHHTTGDLHTKLYMDVKEVLSLEANQKEIREGYPEEHIPRRNTGYALDMLLRHRPFTKNGENFNFCSLVAGSEGTLGIVTEAKIRLTPLPPKHKRLVCIHCESIHESLLANLVALEHNPSASELMDHYILDATKRSILYKTNRFFLEGDPKAILVVELAREDEAEVIQTVDILVKKLKKEGLGYAYPVISGEDMSRVWGLRKAGLGLLSNIPGDAKPAPVIEDTAVNVQQLPDYIRDFNKILQRHNLYSVHYAHAGSGELHLRPILNLKTSEGRRLFRVIAEDIADLVKGYNGSLSGEHGDGRLRGEFISKMLGEHNYELLRGIKNSWDPDGIFNPGKIVDSPPMDTHLRFFENQETPEIDTVFDFSETEGYIRAVEQCNGSGDCRKTELSGGTMCPSFMATRNERDTTRARANVLREYMTQSSISDPFSSEEVKDILDLCLSCKGCKSECPSNVDMAKIKAEWTHKYYQREGVPFRAKQIANFTKGMKLASHVGVLYRIFMSIKPLEFVFKQILGFAPKRSLPQLNKQAVSKWYRKRFKPSSQGGRKVTVFVDEFTEFNDFNVGRDAISLLDELGYQVQIISGIESGRTYLSKGFLDEAREIAERNIETVYKMLDEDFVLVGIEPSAILTFRDEYIDLLRDEQKEKATKISECVFTLEEFLSKEWDSGRISRDQFTTDQQEIFVHGHCHQKALSSMTPTKKILEIPENYKVRMIPSGCCGMAGSFGYEKEHYDLSMEVGELVLFPKVRTLENEQLVVAAGTSCRHQIKDGTDRDSHHPAQVLYRALKKPG